ncbi:MAG: N-acetylmuramoyl-L-alanine amidase, partial [Planctomycetales bacterium]|nr:N-acetylmuramoyl-L-alanine amidase [Planctomycetales bacterium]
MFESLERRQLLAADGYRVVIDPGHGGTVDIGGSGANHATGVVSGMAEKTLSLDLAKQLSGILTDNGFEVTLTRDADVNLSLEDRARTADNVDADFFISIHYNGDDDPGTRGTEVFIRSSGDNVNLENDRLFASNIQNAVVAAIPGGNVRSGSPKQADFGVLYDGWLCSPDEDPVVSALVEIEFISNADADQYVTSLEGSRAIALTIAEAIENSRRDLFRVSDFQLDAASYTAEVGQPLGFSGRLVDADGQPRAGVPVGIEDGVTSASRFLGVTDESGRFSWTYTGEETTAAGPGYFTATLSADGGAVTETIGLSLRDLSLMNFPLDDLRVTQGSLGPPSGVLAESRPFTPVLDGWQIEPASPGLMREAGMTLVRGLGSAIQETATDPLSASALAVASVACPLSGTVVGAAICVPTASFAVASFVGNAVLNTVHEAVDLLADRFQWDEVAREELHNVITASETLWGVVRFKPSGGIRNLRNVLDATDIAIDATSATLELGRDMIGRLTEVRIVAPAADGDGIVGLAFVGPEDPPPHVEQTSPARGETMVMGPNEILVRWSEAMDQSAGLLSTDDLDLTGPGLGTAQVSSVRWV